MVDAYNSTTGRAQTFKVVGKGGLSTLNYDYGKNLGSKIDGLNTTLTSVGKLAAYAVAHDAVRNQILQVESINNIMDIMMLTGSL